jgi:hypothetical protein
MEQRNGRLVAESANEPAAEVATALAEAQQRAHEQRLLVEQLLAEARSIEERLAAEAQQAEMNAARVLVREQAAAALAEAQQEREAIVQLEACAANLADLAQRRSALDGSADDARAAYALAEANVRDLEEKLPAARDMLVHAAERSADIEQKRSELAAAELAAQAENSAATERLEKHRAARERLEAALNAAAERARGLTATEDGDRAPSLEPVEELRLLEARVALRAEAAKRAAERRAADAARNHVIR